MSDTERKKVMYIKPIHPSGMDKLREKYDVIVTEDEEKETILANIEGVHAIISRLSIIDKEIIDKGDKLQVIAKHGAGTNNIDVKYATEKGIPVVTTGNVNSITVAEHVMLVIGALAKRITYFDREQKNGNWNSRNTEGSVDLYGKKLGLIGFGNLGKLVAGMAKNGFNMDVMIYARPHHKESILAAGYTYIDDIDTICRESDFVSLHVAYTEETKNLIDKKRLELMKPSAFLVNFARGGMVNEQDLADALKNGVIAGAAVDVYECEPAAPPIDHPFLGLDNIILSPHVAYATEDAKKNMSLQVAEGIDDVLCGRVPKFAANKQELFGEK